MRDQRCPLCAGGGDEWLLAYDDITPVTEGTREALLALGNGYLATRGAAPEAEADGIHYPASYVAGVYNRLISHIDGHRREDESIVNLPNWLPTTFRPADGVWFTPGTHNVIHHHVALDLRCGLLLRELVIRDAGNRHTRLSQQRLVCMARPHLAAMRTTITPHDWSGPVQIRSLLDGRIRNDNVVEYTALAKHHLGPPTTGHDAEVVWLLTQTNQSRIHIAHTARTTLRVGDEPATAGRRVVTGPEYIGHEFTATATAGTPITIDKVVAVYTSRDRAISEPLGAARTELADAGDFTTLRDAHILTWKQIWRRLHLSFGGADLADDRRAVNVHLFHVAQTLSHHSADLDVGVPARGLHGEGYRGHVFWDDLFVFPLLNLRIPELTRALLLYRHRRLPSARRLAASAGAAGALFPWQSGSDGREETPQRLYNPRSRRWMPDHSRRQYHVNLAVAYNIWHYFQVTADVDFLTAYGAELLVEIARFWASLATYDPANGRYHINGVMGPDEFHDGYPDNPGGGLNDNAYVNILTSWMLARTLDVYRLLGGHHTGDLWERLKLGDGELDQWEHISRRLHVPFLPDGLLSQFAGYADLDELDWDAYRSRYGNIKRLDLILEAEGDTPNRYKASKQADVLMLLYLLSAEELTATLNRLDYPFDPTMIPATVDYYLARTTHGSTLSHVVHAWVLARANRRASWHLFREALDADLSDRQNGTTGEGIHLGAMAATADILQRCYPGLQTRDDALRLHPVLPDPLTHLTFDLRYRGHRLHIHIRHGNISVYALPSAAPPVTVIIDDEPHLLCSGAQLTVDLPARRHTRPSPRREHHAPRTDGGDAG